MFALFKLCNIETRSPLTFFARVKVDRSSAVIKRRLGGVATLSLPIGGACISRRWIVATVLGESNWAPHSVEFSNYQSLNFEHMQSGMSAGRPTNRVAPDSWDRLPASRNLVSMLADQPYAIIALVRMRRSILATFSWHLVAVPLHVFYADLSG